MAAFVPFLTLYLLVVGLAAGSFVNLAADRVPRGESVIYPPSRCRACGRRLNAIDLIPVLGYAIRRGRCASCGTPIGLASPLIEATSGALMLVPVLVFGLWPGAVVGTALVAGFGAAAVAGARSVRS